MERFILGQRGIAGLTLAVYWIALFLGTHVPSPQLGTMPAGADKILHLLAFSGLAFLLGWFWIGNRSLRWRGVGTVLLIIVLYGMVDELTQSAFFDRTPDVFDFTADAVGGLLGISLYAIAYHLVLVNRQRVSTTRS